MIHSRYGQKKGWALHWAQRLRFGLLPSRFFSTQAIEAGPISRVVFVCKGNICRSAFAQAYALGFAKLDSQIHFLSAGLRSGTQGALSPASAQKNALLFGVDLSSHQARPLDLSRGASPTLIESPAQETLFVAFEPWQARELAQRYPLAQVTLLGAWSTERRPHLHDPFGLSDAYFQTCFSLIASGVRHLLRHLNAAPSVLVTEAETLGAIAVIRSLSNAGYAVVGSSTQKDALGFESIHCHQKTLLNYEGTDFFENLDQVIHNYSIQCIIPSETFLMKVRPRLDDYLKFLPFSQQSQVLLSGMSKFDLFKKTSPKNIPPTLFVEFNSASKQSDSELLNALSALGQGPLFVKVDALYGLTSQPGKVYPCKDAHEALTQVRALGSQFTKILVQGFVPGKGIGYFANRMHGKIITEFMHERIHEVPHTGGASSFRRSTWNKIVREDAIQRLADMDWTGPAMVEYRVDGDRIYLMEMNGRFWGSLHLALYAGADFPAELVDAFLQNPCSLLSNTQPSTRPVTYCRHTFPMDFQHTWSFLKDKRIPLASRLLKCLKFAVLGLHPRVYSDLFYPGDQKLYFINLKRYLTLLAGANSRSH